MSMMTGMKRKRGTDMAQKKHSIPNVLYLVDTNILFDLAKHFVPTAALSHKDNRRAAATYQFIKSHRHVWVPDLVWIEFLSAFLHKGIDVSTDLAGTRKWLRDQQTAVQQVKACLVAHGVHFYFGDRIDDLFAMAKQLLTDMPACMQREFVFMQSGARHAYEKGWIKGMVGKMLDGMDSVILAYLHGLAMENPDCTVKLRTNDLPLYHFFPAIKAHHAWFARNAHTQLVQVPPRRS